ncbi:hypothetical protein QNE20_004257 [Vibrio vulnificus]|nr:hypothetical protein [Vibrio vulnificus]ELV8640249.1 hypothetical protein [Vibrio vulnificus]ELV8706723.1 hypothetical protein [Vibrio vulnificus]MCU8527715.1 DUF6082 family protein [Vibrio vulnificus]MCU8531989.1 DUF6082 family protein [Vibrio vulnificus]
MSLNKLLVSCVVLWALFALGIYIFDDLDTTSSFGESFGSISALFSSFALALAIYSIVLQQEQNEQFEQQTLKAMQQQSEAIELIKESLEQQATTAKVSAMTTLIDRDEQKIEMLYNWGKQQGDENKYINGINAAKRRIETYNEQLSELAQS